MKEHHKDHKGEDWRRYRRGPRRGMGFWLLSAAAVMFLWNALVPDLFQGPHIGYFQALGLTILGTLLTGGFPGPGRRHGGWSCSHRGGRNFKRHFREKFREKMKGMSPDERRKFKEAFGAGRWNVNVFEVEEEHEEGEGTDASPEGEPKDDKPDA